jgi:predicted secreted protein
METSGVYTGVSGKIGSAVGSGSPTYWAHIESWNLSFSRSINECAPFGSDYKEKYPGMKDWSGSADGKVDFLTGHGQRELQQAWENGTELSGVFLLDEDTFWEGNFFIESLDITHTADGLAEISISIAGNGGATLEVGE